MKRNRNSVQELERMFRRPSFRCDPQDETQSCVYIDPHIPCTFMGTPMNHVDGQLRYVNGELRIMTIAGACLGPKDIPTVAIPLKNGEAIPGLFYAALAAGFPIKILRTDLQYGPLW
jgi:hypothetical protein